MRTLGAIPRSRAPEVELTPGSLSQAATEAFVLTAAAIHRFTRDQELRSLIVTSAMPDEGKTTIAANLAVALAVRGARVLLVDGNLRRPAIHGLFRLENASGFAEIIEEASTGDGTPNDRVAGMDDSRFMAVASRTNVKGLNLVPAGRLSGIRAVPLDREKLRPLILRLCRLADIVIVDTPAASEGRDALALGASVDTAILAVQARSSEYHAVEWARRSLVAAGTNVLGVVLTHCAPRDLTKDAGQESGSMEVEGSMPEKERSACHDCAR